MSVLWIFLLPLIGAAIAPWIGRAARTAAMAVLAVDALLLVQLWRQADVSAASPWIATWSADWVTPAPISE